MAANIDKYVANGLSLRPETYNADMPLSLFDFPAYQLLAAFVARGLRSNPLVTARLLNVALFAGCLALLGSLLRATGARWPLRMLTLVFFACAPLNLFYFQAPMADPLAVTLALVSLWAYVRWASVPEGGAKGSAALMIGAGVLSALVKNPVYLPVLLAILWHRLRRHGWRSLVSPMVVALWGLCGLAVVAFKLYSNAVNDAPALLATWEIEGYFGPPGTRLQPAHWTPIFETLANLGPGPLALLLAAAGVLLYLRRARSRWADVYTGLWLGSALTVVLFFSRHQVHDYYQLPCLFPLAFFAAYALHLGLLLGRRRRGTAQALAVVAFGAVLANTLVSAHSGLEAMSESAAWVLSRGSWIASHTGAHDFVIYLVGPEGTWNPAYLYFAKRDGINLARTSAKPELLAGLLARFGPGHRQVVVFSSDREANSELAGLGLACVASGRARALYRVPASLLATAAPRPISRPHM